jgi:hypothetical protein
MTHSHSFKAALLLAALAAACVDNESLPTDPNTIGTDGPPISMAVGKPRGGGFDNANNVGSINGTQWSPSPWDFTADIVANGPVCFEQGFCAVGNIINPHFLGPGVLDIGVLSNPDPNPADACIDQNGIDSFLCYGLLSTTNFLEDTTDDNVANPVEIHTLRSGIQTSFDLAPNTGWVLKFDYAVLTNSPPAGSTDAYAAVFLDWDSNNDNIFDQTVVALQIFRSGLEQGNVPLKAGGCGVHTLGGIASSYPLCTGWQSPTIDASFFAGKLVQVRLIVDEGGTDAGVATSFAVDNLKFEETVLLTSIIVSPNPATVGSPANLSATFTDTELGVSHTATIDWGDGTTTPGTITEPAGTTPGGVSGSHSYATPGAYSVVLSVSDGSDAPGQTSTTVNVNPAVIAALIDIRPAVTNNLIFLRLNLPIPVALFGSATFDVRGVPTSSLRFGPAAAPPVLGTALRLDLNRDGYLDLLSSYLTRRTGIQSGDTQACLTGKKNGVDFRGCDAITTVP